MHYAMRSQNVTFRLYAPQIEQIDRAAERAGKSRSDYCRDVLIARAADDVGEEAISLTPTAGRYNSPIRRAARELGISPEELEAQALAVISRQVTAAKRGRRPAVIQGAGVASAQPKRRKKNAS